MISSRHLCLLSICWVINVFALVAQPSPALPDTFQQQLDARPQAKQQVQYLLAQLDSMDVESNVAKAVATRALELATTHQLGPERAMAAYWEAKTFFSDRRFDFELLLRPQVELENALTFFRENKETFWINRCLLLLSNHKTALAYEVEELSRSETSLDADSLLQVADSLSRTVEQNTRLFAAIPRYATVRGEAYRMIGNTHYFTPDSARYYYQQAVKAYSVDAQNTQASISITYTNLGNSLYEAGQFEPALEAHQLAYEYCPPSATDLKADALFEQSFVLAEMAWAFRDTARMHQSNQVILQSFMLDSVSQRARRYHQLGANFQNTGTRFFAEHPTKRDSFYRLASSMYATALEAAVKENNSDIIEEIYATVFQLLEYNSDRSAAIEDTKLLLGAIQENYASAFAATREELVQVQSLTKQVEGLKARQTINRIFIGVVIIGIIALIAYFRQRLRQIRHTFNLRMRMLGAQMNNHFIFNTLNAIDLLILKGKKEEASRYLVKFGKLCRSVLNSSRSSMIPFSEEVNILRHYLDCEQLRLRDQLIIEWPNQELFSNASYEVPPLLLQPFAENAIWHGIMKKTDGSPGILSIDIEENEKQVVCIIEDNGIGRAKAAKLKAGRKNSLPSHGIAITQEKINLIKQMKDASLEVEDLYNEDGSARGTRVVVCLPKI